MTYTYIMRFPSLLQVLKSHETLSLYRRHVREIFIGSIIGWQAQEHME